LKFNYIIFFILVLYGCSFAGISSEFQLIGNEKTSSVDPETGARVYYLTSADHMNTHAYPHSRTFAEDDQYVIVESSRPRPDGTDNGGDFPSYTKERQLLAVNISTGGIYHIDSLLVEDVAQYGSSHFYTSSQYHTDYSPDTNNLVYYDMTGHNLYLMDFDTGDKKLLWHCNEGTIGDPPSISQDGSRIMVYVTHPGPASDSMLRGTSKGVYAIDLDDTTVIKGPYLVYATIDRRLSDTTMGLAHIIVNPANPDEFSFSRGYGGYSDGSIEKTRVWYGRVESPLIKAALPTPAGMIHTHEIWGPQGKYMYLVALEGTGAIWKFDPRTEKKEILTQGINPRCLHVSTCGSERFFVYETQTSHTIKPLDEYSNHTESVYLFDRITGNTVKLSNVVEGLNHPRHVHPQLNMAGDKVVYTESDESGSKIALIELE
jgi:hypothetical protein